LYVLPLAAESVDFLLALNVFHWADRPQLLSEARRVLKKSGKAFLYDVLPLGLDAPRPRVWFSLRREQIATAFGPR
jgi:ubiquinone/menaquinone biosynthesis C-methylase UbiE